MFFCVSTNTEFVTETLSERQNTSFYYCDDDLKIYSKILIPNEEKHATSKNHKSLDEKTKLFQSRTEFIKELKSNLKWYGCAQWLFKTANGIPSTCNLSRRSLGFLKKDLQFTNNKWSLTTSSQISKGRYNDENDDNDDDYLSFWKEN